MSGTAEAEVTGEKRAESRLKGLIRKPQALAGKEPVDTMDALISRARADLTLPSRLMESAAEVKRSIEAATQLYKPELLRDLVMDAGASGTQRRFAAVALHAARAQLKDYKEGLEDDGKKFAEVRARHDAAQSSLKEEQAPMVAFLEKRAPSDERVASLGEQLKEYTEAMEGAREEVDSLGTLLASSRDFISQLERDLDAAARSYGK